MRFLSISFLFCVFDKFVCSQVVITNFENGSILDLDAKKWPEAQGDEASAFYKVDLFSLYTVLYASGVDDL